MSLAPQRFRTFRSSFKRRAHSATDYSRSQIIEFAGIRQLLENS